MPTALELKNALNDALKNNNAKMASDTEFATEFWPTGQLPLDAVLGGGWAKGRMGLATGESATLKSRIGLTTAGMVQKLGGTAGYIDAEHSYDQEWAALAGVNNEELLLMRPETGEEAIDSIEVLMRKDIDYICVDSIAALLPKSERDLMLSGKDNVQPARIAALMAIGLRKLTAANKRTTVFWISQMRDNIGAMAFSPKSNVTGGKAIHYYVSQSLMLRKTGKVYEDVVFYSGQKDASDKQIVQQEFKAEVVKSRFGQPFTQQHFVFDLASGDIDMVGYLIQQGLLSGHITRKAAWWTITLTDSDGVVTLDEKLGSRDKFYDFCSQPEVTNQLLKMVCDKYKLNVEHYV